MTTVISDIIAALVANSSTAIFFNGVQPALSTDYTNPANQAALNSLSMGLIQFFGAALKCTDGTVAPYSGDTLVNLHSPLGISVAVFNDFNDLLVEKVLVGTLGVTSSDANTILTLLQSLEFQIVLPLTYNGYVVGEFASKGLDAGQVVAVVLSSLAGALIASVVLAAFTYIEPKIPKFP